MASKRVATTAVDWVKFAELVPKGQVEAFRAFKAHSDHLVARVHRFPEALPAINWDMYRKRISNPAIVDAFEKQYGSVSVPYPKDPSNTISSIEAQEKAAKELTAKEMAVAQAEIAKLKALLAKIDSVPPLKEMTMEMYYEYFPDQALDPVNKPTFWPHNKPAQKGYDKAHEME